MADLPENQLNRKITDSEAVGREIEAAEAELASLKVAYEQYFLGVERQPPNKQHAEVKKLLQRLKGAFVRQTAIKFRVQSLQNKYLSYERMWARTLMEMENGTYRRDLFKARLHSKKREAPKPAQPPEAEQPAAAQAAGAPAVPSISPVLPGAKAPPPTVAPAGRGQPVAAVAKPGTPAVPARPGAPAAPAPAARPAAAAAPAPVVANQNLSDSKLRAVYDAYVTAKKRCNEDTSKLSYDSVAANLRKQVPELMKKTGAQGVEFKVVIKDGKAILRAVPK